MVFRPFAQIRRSICTSEPLRASTRVSSGFTLSMQSSPSFGSQRSRSYSNPSEDIRIGRRCAAPTRGTGPAPVYLHCAPRVSRPNARATVGLLGPCFKTGRSRPLRQRPGDESRGPRSGLAALARRAVTHRGRCHVPGGSHPPSKPTLACPRASAPAERPAERPRAGPVGSASPLTISRAV